LQIKTIFHLDIQLKQGFTDNKVDYNIISIAVVSLITIKRCQIFSKLKLIKNKNVVLSEVLIKLLQKNTILE